MIQERVLIKENIYIWAAVPSAMDEKKPPELLWTGAGAHGNDELHGIKKDIAADPTDQLIRSIYKSEIRHTRRLISSYEY